MERAIVRDIIEGKIGVMPTDTLYGLVGSALDGEAVERIYNVRKRDPKKPCIILISGIEDLKKFNIELDAPAEELLHTVWPGPVSIILPCISPGFEYLHRLTNSLAFRLPDNEELRALLKETGPLVAPSANPEGRPPATTIAEARDYFGDAVDFYVAGGTLIGPPSRVARIEGSALSYMR